MKRVILSSALTFLIAGSPPSSSAPIEPEPFAGKGTIVFSCSGCPLKNSGPALYTVSASGEGLRKLSTTLSPYGPRWSPNGRQVAFTHGFSRIATLPVPRGSGRLLTNPCIECAQDPAWSPDGRRIAYMNRGRLFTMRADGRHERLLFRVRKRAFGAPDWSPDGRRIAFYASEERLRLYVVGADGRRIRQLRRVRGRYPRWSPSGRWIAFIAQDGTVMVVRSDGTHPRVVARGLPVDTSSSPSWSPDGRHIVFAVRREFEDYTGHELMVAALDGSQPRPIVMRELPPEAYSEIYGVDWTVRAVSS